MEGKVEKRMRILCLHGFRTSGAFLRKQLSKWDPSIFLHFDMEFPDGLFPAGGKSEIEGIFPPPYFEWFQFDKDFTEYTNLEECISHLCEYITTKGPFDGLLGFSQGATLSALLLGYQAQGKVLKEHPPIKLFVSISGSKFRDPKICEIAYKDAIKARSVHFIGSKDWLKLPSEDLATAFDSPLIIRHPQGHTVPRLDEEAVEKMRAWTTEIVLESSKEDSDSKHEVNNKEGKVKEDETKPGETCTEEHEGNGVIHMSVDSAKATEIVLESSKEDSDSKHEVNNKEGKVKENETNPGGTCTKEHEGNGVIHMSVDCAKADVSKEISHEVNHI